MSKKHFIVGIGGHTDHGKTSLVESLTSRNFTFKREDYVRGITVDIGVAHLKCKHDSDDFVFHFIDVPGHEAYLKNMITGTTGIDIFVLVIDAGEGVKAQTIEHLEVAKALGVKRGFTVLTKIDRVDDECLFIAEEEAREFIAESFLKDYPILKFSKFFPETKNEIISFLVKVANEIERKTDERIFRLNVDSSFYIKGIGLVAAGCVVAGRIGLGEQVAVYPSGVKAVIKGMQCNREDLEVAEEGMRVAINLRGLTLEQCDRGSVITLPGYMIPSRIINVNVECSRNAFRPIKNSEMVRLHVGTDSTTGRIFFLDKNELNCGEGSFAQLRLEKPIFAFAGDKFLITFLENGRIAGGGTILHLNPPKLRKKFLDLARKAYSKAFFSETDIVRNVFQFSQNKPHDLSDLARLTSLRLPGLKKIVEDLKKKGALIESNGVFVYSSVVKSLATRIKEVLKEKNRASLRTSELRSFLPFEMSEDLLFEVVNRIVEVYKVFEFRNGEIVYKNASIELTKEQKRIADTIKSMIEVTKVPISLKYIAEFLKRNGLKEKDLQSVINFLRLSGDIEVLKGGFIIEREAFVSYREEILRFIKSQRITTLPELRDHLKIGRKHVQILLEHLEVSGLLKMLPDKRWVLNKKVFAGGGTGI